MSENNKIAIIGPGNIGKATGMALAITGVCKEISFLGRNKKKLEGAVREVEPCADGDRHLHISTSTKPDILKGSDVIVVTAGLPRQEGMSREDLIHVNAPTIQKIAHDIKDNAPDAFVIVVTNPLDAMVELMNRESGLPAHKIIGMAGILDSRRFRAFLKAGHDVDSDKVKGVVVGKHGPGMVPVFSQASINGEKISDMLKEQTITQDRIEEIRMETESAGSSIIRCNGNSAFFSSAACAAAMVESLLVEDKERSFTACVRPNAVNNDDVFYGIGGDISIGVPIVLNTTGVAQTLPLKLSPEEENAFFACVEDQYQMNLELEKPHDIFIPKPTKPSGKEREVLAKFIPEQELSPLLDKYKEITEQENRQRKQKWERRHLSNLEISNPEAKI